MKFKISSKKILFSFAAIIFISIFWRFFSLLYFQDSNIVLQKKRIEKLQPKETLQQKFLARQNGLAKVEILLRSPGINYENGDEVEMKIADNNCQEILRKGNLKESFLDTKNLYEFKFLPIPDSEGKEFCLMATFLPVKDTAKSIQFFKMGEEENQPYSIRPVYKNKNVLQDLNELNQRISQYKPWFLKHYFLGAVATLFILLSAAIVIILIAA